MQCTYECQLTRPMPPAASLNPLYLGQLNHGPMYMYISVNFVGPFMKKHLLLIIIDAVSKWVLILTSTWKVMMQHLKTCDFTVWISQYFSQLWFL